MIKPEESVIVFDLDDTLYSEYDYKCSGIQAVVGTITSLYPQYDADVLNEIADNKSKDWLDNLCHHCKLNELEKQSLLWQYRLHRPVIRPYVEPSFTEADAPFAARALITDGRSLTQRLKIQALGLTDLFDDILISEAMQSENPTISVLSSCKTNIRLQNVSSTSATTSKRFCRTQQTGLALHRHYA